MTLSCEFRGLFALAKQDSRAEHQINFYSKTLAAEVTEWAAKESAGVPVPKNTLAKNIFAWAWPIYKASGSLANLKKITFSTSTVALELAAHASGRVEDDTKGTFDPNYQARLEAEVLERNEPVKESGRSSQGRHSKKEKRA